MKKNLLPSCLTSGTYLKRSGLALALLGLAPAAFGQTFATVVTYPAGNNANPLSLALADVNNDGKRDIITANNGSSVVGVLLGSGTGTFAAVTTTSAGTNTGPYDIAVADVNADGKLDVLTANYNTSNVSVLLGNGNGGFAAAVTYSTGAGSQPFGLAVADVNADGKPDIISANTYSQSVGVLLGNGNGTFAAVTAIPTGTSAPNKVAVADVNADGKPDIISANGNGNLLGVLLGNGNGTFQAFATTALGASNSPSSLALADLNADGKLDVVVTISYGGTSGGGTVGVLLGNGNGTFASLASYGTGSSSFPNSVAVADVSGDGKPDIITANAGNYSAGVLVNNGNGTFKAVTTFLAGSSNNPMPYGVAVADVNGDNKPDVVTSNVSTNTVSVLLNTSTFLAARPATLPADLTLYPNPTFATAAFTASSLPTEVRSVEATLFNSLGQAVGQATVAAAQGTAHTELPTAGLAPGIYLVRLNAVDAQGAVVGALPTQRLCVR
ncbi:MAG: FG-GAP-like repeat-containing protein [Janthinobacterium lividum]